MKLRFQGPLVTISLAQMRLNGKWIGMEIQCKSQLWFTALLMTLGFLFEPFVVVKSALSRSVLSSVPKRMSYPVEVRLRGSKFASRLQLMSSYIELTGAFTPSLKGFMIAREAHQMLFGEYAVGLGFFDYYIYQMRQSGMAEQRWCVGWFRNVKSSVQKEGIGAVYFPQFLKRVASEDGPGSADPFLGKASHLSAKIKDALNAAGPSCLLPNAHSRLLRSFPEASLRWDSTYRYLSIEAITIDLGLLANSLLTVPEIRAVQVCTEAISLPKFLDFPCSLELCHRPSVKLNASITSGSDDPSDHQLPIESWQVRGDFVCYSPHDILSFFGDVYIEGDACFQVRAMRLMAASTLQVGGSFVVFTHLWNHIQPHYAYSNLGLRLEDMSWLVARQGFMELNRFYASCRGNLGFLETGILLLNENRQIDFEPLFNEYREVEGKLIPLSWKNNSSFWQRSGHNLQSAEETSFPQYAPFVLPSVPAKEVRKASALSSCALGQVSSSQERFFSQWRRNYYTSTCMSTELEEDLKILDNCWQLVRRCEIALLFTGKSLDQLIDKPKTYLLSNAPQRSYGIELTCIGAGEPYANHAAFMFLGFYDVEACAAVGCDLQTVSSRLKENLQQLIEFPAAQDFLPHGAHKLYQLYYRQIWPLYKSALTFWTELGHPFFNADSFRLLLAPFLGYYMG